MFKKIVCMVLFSTFALQAQDSIVDSPKGLNHSVYRVLTTSINLGFCIEYI